MLTERAGNTGAAASESRPKRVLGEKEKEAKGRANPCRVTRTFNLLPLVIETTNQQNKQEVILKGMEVLL